MESDVRHTFPEAIVVTLIRDSVWNRRIHLYGFGAPCQPFSNMGMKKGKRDPRSRVLRKVCWNEIHRVEYDLTAFNALLHV